MNNPNLKLNILYCLDEKNNDYSRHLWVSLLSLLETNQTNRLHIYIISASLQEKNKAELQRLADSYWQEISFYVWNEIIPTNIEKLLVWKDRGYWWPLAMFYRIFWWNIWNISDRILYMDCDIIVVKDLKSFYETDFGWKSIIWAKDCPATNYERKLHLWINEYINSGVLLMNADKIRDIDRETEIKKVNKLYANLIKFPDMDYINLIFQWEMKILPNEINTLLIWQSKIDRNGTMILHTIKKPRSLPSLQPKSVVKLYNSYLSQTKWKSYAENKKITIGNLFLRLLEKFWVIMILGWYKLFGDKWAYWWATLYDSMFFALSKFKKKILWLVVK